MKNWNFLKIHALIVLLLLLSPQRGKGQDTLLVIHPTADNIHLLDQLIEKGYFPLEGYHLLGVYHEDESYDYEKASDFIRDHRLRHVSLVEVKGTLDADNTFLTNNCTDQFARLFDISRGALFFGGPDIPPLVYQESAHLLTRVTDPFRHFFELSFLHHLLGGSRNPDWKPFLESRDTYLVSGICLGIQTMNVATGGTLIQDIPTEIYGVWTAEELLSLPAHQQHRNYHDLLSYGSDEPTSYHFHPIRVEKGSFLDFEAPPAASDPLVLSSHHQAIETLANGWKVAASSLDGKVIEAIEHEKYPHVFGVQFHPEKPGLFDPSRLHLNASGDSVSFIEVIRGTFSFEFHENYWRAIAAPLLRED